MWFRLASIFAFYALNTHSLKISREDSAESDQDLSISILEEQ